jgi:two-component system, sensor histidine kinase
MASAPRLIDDPRLRAEVVATLLRGVLVSPIVITLAIAVVWWQFRLGHLSWVLGVALACWWLNSLVYVGMYAAHRAQTAPVQASAQATWRYLHRLLVSRYIDYTLVGIGSWWMFGMQPELVLIIALGVVMYMYVSFMKNAPYAALTRWQSVCMLAPLTVAFATSGQAQLVGIAGYFVINTIALYFYGRHYADMVQLQITQRFQLENLAKELQTERDRADAANASKSRFFTAASHDARQPLQAIALLFQSFQKSAHASEADKHTLAKIDLNLQTIRNLFDRVLDISRIDSGTITPRMEPMGLQALFDKLDAQFGELAAARGLWLRFAPTQACVQHDPQLLERMVSNLVHNALKYTAHGGVWVGWRAARGQLEVRDSGLGISSADQATIFQEFAQLANTERNNEAGLGLGLSIVKRLADLTHTPLGLRSAPGRGSTFWLRLALALPMAGKVAVTTPLVAPVTAPVQPGAQPTQPITLSTHSGQPSLRHLHILYAEDHAPLRGLVTHLLQSEGATVYPCADVLEAQALLRSGAVLNLVLADYRLGPSGTGLDVVHAARTQHGATLPAVLLTGDTAVKDLAAIQQLTHITLLHKPVDGDQLVLALHTAASYRR